MPPRAIAGAGGPGRALAEAAGNQAPRPVTGSPAQVSKVINAQPAVLIPLYTASHGALLARAVRPGLPSTMP